jgi:hypothetical protein
MSDSDIKTCPPFECLPARLHVKLVALKLGFGESEIPILMGKGLLKPLGKPAPNAPKFFARVEIERLSKDIDWLDEATLRVTQYWKRKRDRKAKGTKPDA